MAREIIFNVEESTESAFEASAVSTAVFTQAETREELRAMVVDAVRCHFEGEERPEVIRLRFAPPERSQHGEETVPVGVSAS